MATLTNGELRTVSRLIDALNRDAEEYGGNPFPEVSLIANLTDVNGNSLGVVFWHPALEQFVFTAAKDDES